MGKHWIIMAGEAVVGFLAASVINAVVDKSKQDSKKIAKKNVENNLADDVHSIMRDHQVVSKEARDIRKRESDAVARKVAAYKSEHKIDQKLKDLAENADKAVEDFKEALDYEGNVSRMRKEAEDSIAAYREKINYDNLMDSYDIEERQIRSWYDKEKEFIKLFSFGEDDRKTKTQAAKKKRNENLHKVTQKRRYLRERLDNFTNGANRRVDNEIDRMDQMIKRRSTDVHAEANKDISRLTNEINEVSSKAMEEIRNARSTEDQIIFERENDLNSKVSEINRGIDVVANDISSKMSTTEKVIQYLNYNNVGKGTVWFFGLAPVAFFGHVLVWWITIVAKVASSMAK